MNTPSPAAIRYSEVLIEAHLRNREGRSKVHFYALLDDIADDMWKEMTLAERDMSTIINAALYSLGTGEILTPPEDSWIGYKG